VIPTQGGEQKGYYFQTKTDEEMLLWVATITVASGKPLTVPASLQNLYEGLNTEESSSVKKASEESNSEDEKKKKPDVKKQVKASPVTKMKMMKMSGDRNSLNSLNN
jgi:hypothetical protein